MSERKNGLTYAEAGVDIDAGNAMVEKIKPLVRSTRRPGANGEIGGFGGLFDLKAAGFNDPVLVAANDGVGTKLKVAIEAGIHDTVGIDLVAMCVNDLVVQGAEPLFFLDYFATGKLDPDQGAAVVGGIARGLPSGRLRADRGRNSRNARHVPGRRLRPGGFCSRRRRAWPVAATDDIVEGDVLLGLASSGVHSNGFSLVRRIVSESGLRWSDPAPFADDRTLGAALLEPTRIYVRSVLRAIRGTHGIKALAHITGGGFAENIPRVLPKDFAAELDLEAIEVPPVFSWLARMGGVRPAEMMRTFNCGVGMILVVASGQAAQVAAVLQEAGENVSPIGRIVPRRDAGVIYRGSIDL